MQKKYLFQTLLFLLPLIAAAQETKVHAALTIEGDIPKAIVYSDTDFNKLTRIELHVKDMKGQLHDFSGFAITDILKMAGIFKPEFHRDNLTKYVIVQSSDNYEVLFSLVELDSSFSGRTIILADQMDGKPLPEDKAPYRIIVPGEDKKEARWLWSIQKFVIRNGKD